MPEFWRIDRIIHDFLQVQLPAPWIDLHAIIRAFQMTLKQAEAILFFILVSFSLALAENGDITPSKDKGTSLKGRFVISAKNRAKLSKVQRNALKLGEKGGVPGVGIYLEPSFQMEFPPRKRGQKSYCELTILAPRRFKEAFIFVNFSGRLRARNLSGADQGVYAIPLTLIKKDADVKITTGGITNRNPYILRFPGAAKNADENACLIVTKNPCFAVTDETGRFKICGLPVGTHSFSFGIETLVGSWLSAKNVGDLN